VVASAIIDLLDGVFFFKFMAKAAKLIWRNEPSNRRLISAKQCGRPDDLYPYGKWLKIAKGQIRIDEGE
jgi:hypothetical protein